MIPAFVVACLVLGGLIGGRIIARPHDRFYNAKQGVFVGGFFAAVILAIVLAISGFVRPAGAQGVNCGPFEAINGVLTIKHGEEMIGYGQSVAGRRTAIYANLETGAWTAVQIQPNGLACVVDHGQGWADALRPVGEPT